MTKNTIPDMPQHLISMEDIDDRPNRPYCMSFEFDLTPLIRSIEKVGFINLPLLIRNEDKTLDVVLGFRRIKALKSLGWEKIPCKIFSESEMSPLECLLLSLNDNLATRTFNEVEKAMACFHETRTAGCCGPFMAMPGPFRSSDRFMNSPESCDGSNC